MIDDNMDEEIYEPLLDFFGLSYFYSNPKQSFYFKDIVSITKNVLSIAQHSTDENFSVHYYNYINVSSVNSKFSNLYANKINLFEDVIQFLISIEIDPKSINCFHYYLREIPNGPLRTCLVFKNEQDLFFYKLLI